MVVHFTELWVIAVFEYNISQVTSGMFEVWWDVYGRPS